MLIFQVVLCVLAERRQENAEYEKLTVSPVSFIKAALFHLKTDTHAYLSILIQGGIVISFKHVQLKDTSLPLSA